MTTRAADTPSDPVVADKAWWPSDDELDVYGLTHKGKVRATNEDLFLVASLH